MILLGLAVTYPFSAQAQIASDSSVGTLVNASVSSVCTAGTCTVTGGTESGSNLFHSFSAFSPIGGSTALFQVDPGIANIITRVTGGQASTIDGTIQTGLTGNLLNPGTANLFLINPNGIVFGPGARLDIGGSFLASTAESIIFSNGVDWSTRSLSPAPSLLSISTPIGLQMGTQPTGIQVGTVENSADRNNLSLNLNFSINRDQRPDGLVVPTEETLAFIGGDITLTGGNLTAPTGQIILGSLGEAGQVGWQSDGTWQFDYSDINTFGDITLTNAASADVSGNSSGSIQVRGQVINLSDGSAFVMETLGNGTGGVLSVEAESILLEGISTAALPTPPPSPFPFPLPPNNPMPTGFFADVATGQSGSGGNLIIDTETLTVTGGAQVTAITFGTGSGGDLTVRAQDIDLIGGTPFGPSGLLTGVAPDGPIYAYPPATATPTLVGIAPPASGSGGDLTIETNRLSIRDGAQAYASSFGLGDAGNFNIQADVIEVSGGNPGGPSLIDSSAQSPFPDGGSGGTLNINTRQLQITDGGQVSTSTVGGGNAGNLLVSASDSVEIIGQDEQLGRSGLFSVAISAAGLPPGTGDGGNITVNTNSLSVRDGATISVSNFPSSDNPGNAPGVGPAGNLNLTAQTILLSNEAILNAETNHSDSSSGGGNINLQADAVLLRQNSLINANAQGSATGGNINIDTGTLIALENSDITANAIENFGGRVTVNAATIIGTQFREQLTPESDITASSALGPQFSGTVELTSPEIDPAQGIATLSEAVAASDQVAAACSIGADNDFVATGRGGVPEDASQALRGSSLWQDLRLADAVTQENTPDTSAHEPPSNDTTTALSETIIEAQGVTMSADGKVSFWARPSGQQVANHQHHCSKG